MPRVMAVAVLVTVNICARIFDRVTERYERLVRRFGQLPRVPWRGHDSDTGDFPTDMDVVPIDVNADTRQAILFDEPERHVADVLLHPEPIRIDAQTALARHLKDTTRPGLNRHDGTAREGR